MGNPAAVWKQRPARNVAAISNSARMDQDPEVDPWADDLATLPLDLLVDQEGFERAGFNVLLLQGGQGGQ